MRILPLLSESLKGIFEQIKNKDYDPIIAEILEINSKLDALINVSYGLPVPYLEEILDLTINNRLTDECRMITARMGSDFEVSYLPKGREPEYTDRNNWARHNRQTGKPARIFQKLLKKEFKTYDWEKFSNRFQAELCNCSEFEIVSGSDITHRCDGTLGNSCMRYDNAQDYFGIYEDSAKMLITKKDGLLTGRAILWEVDGITIMDRVYTCFDYLEDCFYNYAKENKWWIRENNSLLHTGEDQYWRTPEDNYESCKAHTFTIHLKKHYDYYPYVDSFRYFDGDKTITNVDGQFNCSLDYTDGGYSSNSVWVCDSCGHEFRSYSEDDCPEELHYSEAYDRYYCDDCCYWADELDDYYPTTDPEISVNTDSGLIYIPESFVKDNLLINNTPSGHCMERTYVYIDGAYYDVDLCEKTIVLNEETNRYEIRPDSE